MGFLNKVKIKLLNEAAKIPLKSTKHSAGFDVFSAEETILKKGEYKAVSTGISIEMSEDIEAQIRPRSGLALKYGVTVLNSPGTIDADYRGEVKIILINHSENDFLIRAGDRIAQAVFSKVIDTEFEYTCELGETERGGGGFGSTGI